MQSKALIKKKKINMSLRANFSFILFLSKDSDPSPAVDRVTVIVEA